MFQIVKKTMKISMFDFPSCKVVVWVIRAAEKSLVTPWEAMSWLIQYKNQIKPLSSQHVPTFIGDICPEGFYCSGGADSPVPCPNATFVNHTGASYCYTCPAGSYCVNRDRADDCIQGYYCPEGTGADLQPCPLGTFGNTTGLSEVGHCTQCTGEFTRLLLLLLQAVVCCFCSRHHCHHIYHLYYPHRISYSSYNFVVFFSEVNSYNHWQ